MRWPNGSTERPQITTGWLGYPGHYGCDFVGFVYNRAPAAGTVVMSAYNGTAGNEARLRLDTGEYVRLLHHASLWLSYGERVEEGQITGVMGTTGASTGVHCHEGILVDGNVGEGYYVDPVPYTQDRLTGAPGTSPAYGGTTPFPNNPPPPAEPGTPENAPMSPPTYEEQSDMMRLSDTPQGVIFSTENGMVHVKKWPHAVALQKYIDFVQANYTNPVSGAKSAEGVRLLKMTTAELNVVNVYISAAKSPLPKAA